MTSKCILLTEYHNAIKDKLSHKHYSTFSNLILEILVHLIDCRMFHIHFYY